MSTTKAVVVVQTDQILDTPTVRTSLLLKDATATNALTIDWNEPAAPRTVTFTDPGANDNVVYTNATQTLTNKTLSGVTLPDQPQYAHLAGQAGGQTLRGGTAASENLVLGSTTNVTKGAVQIEDHTTLASGKNVTVSGGGELTGLPSTPSGGTAATSKTYVDNQISLVSSSAASFKETLLTSQQLDNPNKAIGQAAPFFLTANPVAGDTLVIKDSSTTETFNFQAVSGAFQPQIGGTVLITMQNLVSTINSDSTKWKAVLLTTMQSLNATGNVVAIIRKVPTNPGTDRIYGVFTPITIAKYVNLSADPDYRSTTVSTLGSVDPGARNFGISRVTADLTSNEVHPVRNEDLLYTWDNDSNTWKDAAGVATLATSAPGGGVVGVTTFDSSLGLNTTAGVTSVKVDSTSISFNGSGQLQQTGGVVPVATAASGGGVIGKLTADSDFGLSITAGIAKVKIDNTTVGFNLSGQLKSIAPPTIPTGLVTKGIDTTTDITAITPPTNGTIGTDIRTLDHPDGSTTGQKFDFIIPDDYDSGNLEIFAVYQMSTAFVGNVRYETQAKIVKISGSIDTTTYPATAATLTPPATATPTRSLLLTLTSGTFSVGDTIQVYVKRLGADGADTHTGVWQVASYQYRYTGQVSSRTAVHGITVFSDAAGETATTPGTIGTDIPTENFPTTPDTAQKVTFIVPDNWDGTSDAFIRLTYAMSTAVASSVVRIRTSAEIVDVFSGTITTLPNQDFDLVPANNTNPARTPVVRSIPAASLHKGNVIKLVIKRVTSGVTGNHTGSWQVVDLTDSFLLLPTGAFTPVTNLEYYLEDGVFGNITGPALVSGTVSYPIFSGDFEKLWTLESTTSGSGGLHVAFEGRLAGNQTTVEQIKFSHKAVSGSPSLTFKVYFEGGGATPVYMNTYSPTGTITEVTVPTSSYTQPTGQKRFFAVFEGSFSAISKLGVSQPFVKVS